MTTLNEKYATELKRLRFEKRTLPPTLFSRLAADGARNLKAAAARVENGWLLCVLVGDEPVDLRKQDYRRHCSVSVNNAQNHHMRSASQKELHRVWKTFGVGNKFTIEPMPNNSLVISLWEYKAKWQK